MCCQPGAGLQFDRGPQLTGAHTALCTANSWQQQRQQHWGTGGEQGRKAAAASLLHSCHLWQWFNDGPLAVGKGGSLHPVCAVQVSGMLADHNHMLHGYSIQASPGHQW